MQPRHLYNSIFAWLVFTGGRYTAPFLESVANFDDTLTGLALALQFGILSLLGSLSGWVADALEVRYPRRGRCAVLACGMGLATAAFVTHDAVGRIWPGEGDGSAGGGAASSSSAAIVAHMVLRVVFSVGLSAVLPVLDGMTLAFLEEGGMDRTDYGKERLYGAIGWALASVILGPFIDRFGFEVLFWFGPISFALCLILLAVFSMESERIYAAVHISESTPLKRTEAIDSKQSPKGGITAPVEPLNLEHNKEPPNRPNLWSLLRTVCGSVYAMCFVTSCIVLAMGTSVVESLIFLFFQGELGGSNTVCGLTIVVTVLFELPIFQLAPQLLRKFGVVGMQEMACIAYIVRVVGYTYVPPSKVLLVLLLEPLHGVTYGFTKTSSVEFVAEMSPKGYEASSQGLLSAFVGLGSVVGLSVGGWAEDYLGAKSMYRMYATVVGCGLLVLVLGARLRRRSLSSKEGLRNGNANVEVKLNGVQDVTSAMELDSGQEPCTDSSTIRDAGV